MEVKYYNEYGKNDININVKICNSMACFSSLFSGNTQTIQKRKWEKSTYIDALWLLINQ